MLLGQAHTTGGDNLRAAEAFTKASERFDELDAILDARSSRAPSSPPRTCPRGLTEREVEVPRLLATGRSNRELAGGFNLSEKTVSCHLTKFFANIDVSTRAAATAFAYEHDIVTHPRVVSELAAAGGVRVLDAVTTRRWLLNATRKAIDSGPGAAYPAMREAA